MNLIWKNEMKRNIRRRLESGNAILMLFAVVGMAGVVTYGLNNVMRGPAVATAEVSRRTIAENNLVASTRLAIAAATKSQIRQGDCDGDGFIEPVPYRDAGALPKPTGGGLLPQTMGGSLTDPWGAQYGYCVWDSGTASVSDNVTECGGAAALRLEGSPREDQPVLAVISAGKDGIFQTSCNAYVDTTPADGVPDTPLVNKPAGSDDVVLSHTYAEANGIGAGEWKLKAADPTTAEIAKDLEVQGGAAFSGALRLQNKGLVLPGDPGDDSVTGACDESKDQQLRRNTSTVPPQLEICDFINGNTWTTVSGGNSNPMNGFDPNMGNCGQNGGGPLAVAGQVKPTGTARTVWSNGSQVFVGVESYGIYAYSFDGTNFTPKGSYDTPGTAYGIWGDGTYIYVADGTGGLLALSYNSSISTFTLAGSTPGAPQVLGVWGDGSYIYAADGVGGVKAYTFNGSAFTAAGTHASGNTEDVFSTGQYVFAADQANGLLALSYNGVAFTLVDSVNTVQAESVWADQNYVYVGSEDGSGINAYSFDGTDLSFIASYALGDFGEKIWGDGVNIYVATKSAGITALRFDGAQFTQVSIFDTVNGQDVWGDGTYIYLADGTNGLMAFGGFACTGFTSAAPTDEADPGTLTDGSDNNLAAYLKMDENTGTTVNDEIGYTPGTFVNSPTWIIPGINSSSAVHFDIDDQDRIEATTGDASYIGSISFWANLEEIDVNGSWAVSFRDALIVAVEKDEGVVFRYHTGGGSYNTIESSTQILGTGWHHIVVTYHGPNRLFRIYIDGVMKADVTTAQAISYSGRPNMSYIGGASAAGKSWGGALDDMRLYGSFLSPAEVKKLYDRDHSNSLAILSPKMQTSNHISPQTIAVGAFHSCAIKKDTGLWCWGTNGQGQLGNGAIGTNASSPARILMQEGFSGLSGGYGHTCAIQNPGRLWCWGQNDTAQTGTGACCSDIDTPAEIVSAIPWTSVTTGKYHSCGIKLDGTGWCWGSDSTGQLGNAGTTGVQNNPSAVSGGHQWRMLSAGTEHTCGLKTDKTIWCWGRDNNGQLGNGSVITSNQTSPYQIDDPGPWAWVSAGGAHTCGVKYDGSGWCWGSDTNGRLGNGTAITATQDSPSPVVGGQWAIINAGPTTSCGIKTDGSGWCWGSDTNGKLGNGATLVTDQSIPSPIGFGNWVDITPADNHTCGTRQGGDVWCWGSDADNQLGNGAVVTASQSSPYVVSGAIDPWTWEWDNTATDFTLNSNYNLAIGTSALLGTAAGPQLGYTAAGNFRELGSANLPLALRIQTTAANSSAQITFATDSLSPADLTANLVGYWKMDDAAGASTIAATNGAAGTLTNSPVLTDTYGRMNGSLSVVPTSAQYAEITDAAYLRPTAITVSYWVKSYGPQSPDSYIFAKTHSNHTGSILQSYGASFMDSFTNRFSWLTGGGGTWNKLTAKKALADNEWVYVTLVMDPSGPAPQKRIYMNGVLDNAAVNTTALVYDGGSLFLGQAGCASPCLHFNGEIDDFRIYNIGLTDAQVAQLYAFVTSGMQVPRSMGVDTTNNTFEIGRNNATATNWMNGITGDLNITSSGDVGVGTSTPQAALDINGAIRIGADYLCSAPGAGKIRYVPQNSPPWQYCNGTAWTNFSSSVQVPWRSERQHLSVDGQKGCALRYDGALYCWGNGQNGTLGDGNLAAHNSHTPIPVQTNSGPGSWSDWIWMSSEWRQGCGIRADGTAWCWGEGGSGELGNGATSNSARPVQVQTDTGPGGWNDWVQVESDASLSCGVRADGSAWCWGMQDNGRLGNGSTAAGNSTRPSQVKDSAGTGYWTDWKMVSVDGTPAACGVRYNGTAWCWGATGGRLGEGNVSPNTGLPVQVQTDTGPGAWSDWVFIDAGPENTCGIRVDGSAWCWGTSDEGQLGTGDLIHQNRPKQVRNSTDTGYWYDWVSISQDMFGTCGIRRNGTAWCWGTVRVGDGSAYTLYMVPKQVPDNTGVTYWSDWTSIKYSQTHICGARSNGTIWCWGSDGLGQLGNGPAGASFTPTQVVYP